MILKKSEIDKDKPTPNITKPSTALMAISTICVANKVI